MPRILREALEGTVFITRGKKAIGTGFLVAIPDYPDQPPVFEPRFEGACYVVTARHIQTNREGLGIRINDVNGQPFTIPTDAGQWWESENKAADVAIAYLPPSPRYERHMTDVAALVEDQWLAEYVGIGDEVETIGLFSRAPGTERNAPIVRFGHIARMNEELTPAEFAGKVYELDAIRVEMQSWAGQSGSPAIVTYPRAVPGLDGWQQALGLSGSRLLHDFAVLGVVSGHWYLPAVLYERINRAVSPEEAQEAGLVHVNSGIALVTPSQHILDLLNREDVMADRKKRRASERPEDSAAALDAVEEQEQAMTRQDFDAALRKVSRRKPSPPDEGTSGT